MAIININAYWGLKTIYSMINHHTHNLKNNVLGRAMLRLGVLCAFLFFILLEAFTQYQYSTDCGGGAIPASEILAGAIQGGGNIPLADQTGGTFSWDVADGIVFSATDETALITKTGSNRNYDLVWTVPQPAPNPDNVYNIKVHTNNGVTAPVVNSFEPRDGTTTVCAPYNAGFTIDISGGTGTYNIQWNGGAAGGISNTSVYSKYTELGATTYNTISLVEVIDANGCRADLSVLAAADIVYVAGGSPSDIAVAGASKCMPNTLTVDLNSSESGVEYVLRRGATDVESWTSPSDGDAHTFDLVSGEAEYTAGSYSVYAVNTCGGADIDVSANDGGPFVLMAEPVVQAVSIIGAGPYCAGNTYTVQLANSEAGVTYTLYDPVGTQVGASQTPGAAGPLTFGPQALALDGDYKITARVGTCSKDMGTVTVGVQPASFTLQDISGKTSVRICSGSSVDLYLSNTEFGVNYQVFDALGNAQGGVIGGTASGAVQVATVSNAGTYHVVATNITSGCTTNMGNLSATVVSLPSGSFNIPAGTTFEKCEDGGETFNLSYEITPSNQGPWNITFSDGGTDYVANTNLSSTTWTTPNVNNTTTYYITRIVDDNGCVNDADVGSVDITVHPKPDITINTDDPSDAVCDGEDIILTADVGPFGIVVDDYNWSTGDHGAAVNSITVTPDAVINSYDVIVTSDQGCVETVTKNVTFNTLPDVKLTSPQNVFCQNDAAVTLTGTPAAGGNYSIGSDNLDPSVLPVGAQDITYTYTDGNGCTNVATVPIVVNPVPNVNIPDHFGGAYCADDPDINITNVTPNGSGLTPPTPGTFTILPNVTTFFTDNNDATADFSVAGAIADNGPGDYTITYTYTNEYTCTSSDDITITVNPDLNAFVSFAGLNNYYCGDIPAETVPLTGTDPAAAGATREYTITPAWTGAAPDPRLTDNGDGTATFYPGQCGGGDFDITYTYTEPSGCNGSQTQTVTIGADLTFTLDGLEFCYDDAVQTLDGSPDGGTFSITYPDGSPGPPTLVDGDNTWFDPSRLDAGDYQITYKYDNAGCIITQTYTATIKKRPHTGFTIEDEGNIYCEFGPRKELTPETTHGVRLEYTNIATAVTKEIYKTGGKYYFDPEDAGPGEFTITLTNDSAGCVATESKTVKVHTSPTLDFTADVSYCDNELPIIIQAQVDDGGGSVFPNAGTFASDFNASSIPLVKDEEVAEGVAADDGQGYLNPGVGAGVYDVTYTYTHPTTGCVYSETKSIEIFNATGAQFTINGSSADNMTFCKGTILTLEGIVVDPVNDEGSFPVQADRNIDVVNSGSLDGKATLDTKDLVVGTPYKLEYQYKNGNGCITTSVKTFTVIDGPVDVYMVSGGGAYCYHPTTPSGVDIELLGSTAGVTYELRLEGIKVDDQVSAADGDVITFAGILAEGTYSIWAVMGTCEAPMNGTVEVDEYNLVLFEEEVIDETCENANDGYVRLRGEGGSGNYTYEYQLNGGAWTANTPAHENEFSGLVPGNYIFRVTDQDMTAVDAPCELPSVREIAITINEVVTPLSVTAPVANISAAGCTADGSATLVIQGGTRFTDLITYPSGYQISWPASVTNISADSLTATGLADGTYDVDVTDANGCTGNVTVTIGLEDGLTLTWNSQTENKCYGTDIAKAQVTAANGSGVYEFSMNADENWLTSAGGADFETPILNTGNHTIWVRDANHPDCKTSVSVNITGPTAPFELDVTPYDEVCSGANDGSVKLNVKNGTLLPAPLGNYRYMLDAQPIANVPATFIVENLSPGTHTITIFDDYDCSVTKVFSIDVALNITLSGVATPVSCYDAKDGRVELTANPTTANYVYSADGGSTWQPSNIFGNLDPGAGLLTKDFTFKAKDILTGCESANITIAVTQPDYFNATLITETDITCVGESSGAFEITTEYGVDNTVVGTFVYSVDGGLNWDSSPITGLTAGNYDIIIKDVNTGCTKTVVNQEIEEPTSPLTAILDVDLTKSKLALNCYDDNDGVIDIDMGTPETGWGAPYTYSWRRKENNAPVDAANVAADGTASSLIAGTYVVTVEDAGGCATTFEQEVTAPDAWNVNISTTPNTLTVGGNGTATLDPVTGGIKNDANYEYRWYAADGTLLSGADVTQTTWSGLEAGSYYVLIADDQGYTCEYREDFVIADGTSTLTINVPVPAQTCFGETGKLEVTILTGMPPYDISITRDSDPAITDVTSQSTYVLNNIIEGNYTVKVVDANGNEDSETVVFATLPEFTVTPTVNYNNCRAELDVQVTPGDYTIYWTVPVGVDPIHTSGENVADIVDVNFSTVLVTEPGDYTFTVISNTTPACTYTETLTVTEPSLIVTEDLTRHKDVSCFGKDDGYIAIEVTGRAPANAVNYVWENITDDPGNTITINGVPTLGDNHNVGKGTWRVIVSTSDGSCSETLEIVVDEADPFMFVAGTPVVTDILSCASDNSGRIQVELQGGTMPYEVTVTDGTYSETKTQSYELFTFENLPAGDFEIRANDANNCGLIQTTATVNAPIAVSVTDFSATINCDPANANDGIISFDISGGAVDASGDNTYAIIIEGNGVSHSVTTQANTYSFKNTTGLLPGTYTVKVWDAQRQAGVNVTCPTPDYENTVTLEPVVVTGDITHNSCNGGTTPDGAITNIQVTGVSGNMTYEWFKHNGTNWVPQGAAVAGANISDYSGLEAGRYRLQISDDGDIRSGGLCTFDTDEFIIEDAKTLTLDFNKTNVSCFEGNNGVIELIASPAGGNYVYSIDDGATWSPNPVFSGLSKTDATVVPAVEYRPRVQDLDYGCEAVPAANPVITEELPEIIIQAATINSYVKCTGGSEASFTVNVDVTDPLVEIHLLEFAISTDVNGDPIYQNSPTFTGLSAGHYPVWVRFRGTECANTVSDYVEIEDRTPITISGTVTDIVCYGADNGEIDITVSGGWEDEVPAQNYTYQWRKKDNNENFGTNEDLEIDAGNLSVPAGTYVVTVQDELGCTATFEETITSPDDWNISLDVNNNTLPNPNYDVVPDGTGNGSVTLGPVNGGTSTGIYTYNWYLDNPSSADPTTGTPIDVSGTSMSLTGLNPNNTQRYYLVVDGDGAGTCADKIVEFTIADESKPLDVTITETNPTCGYEFGSIEFVMNSGTAPYEITLRRGSEPEITATTSNNIYEATGLDAGIYAVTVKDAAGGEITDSKTIIASTNDFNITATPSIAGCTGSIQVDVLGLPATDYTINWLTVPVGVDPSGFTSVITNGTGFTENNLSVAGEYIIRLTHDVSGCYQETLVTLDEPSFTVTENLAGHNDITCNGDADGALAVVATGRELGHLYTYEWSNDGWVTSTSTGHIPSIHNISGGIWEVRVTSVDGCTRETAAPMVVEEPDAMVITPTVTDVVTCEGDASGIIEVTVDKGTAPYIVYINNGTISRTITDVWNTCAFTDLPEGNYTLSVKDANGCIKTHMPNVVVADISQVSAALSATIACSGVADGVIDFTISGGVVKGTNSYRIIIDGDNGFYKDVTVSGNTYTESNLEPGTYDIKIQDANKDGDTGYCIEWPFEDRVTLEYVTVTGVVTHNSCNGGTVPDGSITNVIVSGTDNFDWELRNITAGVLVDSDVNASAVPNFTGLIPATYTLTISDNGTGHNGVNCPVTQPFIVEDAKELTLTVVKDGVSCYGGNDGSIEIIASPSGGNYVYSFDANAVLPDVPTWSSLNILGGLDSDHTTLTKSYFVQVKDLDYGCTSAIEEVVITQPGSIVVDKANVNVLSLVQCPGGSDASFEVVATNNEPLTHLEYAIRKDSTGNPVYQDSPVFENVSAGTYPVWVRRKGTDCFVYESDYIVVDDRTPITVTGTVKDIDCYGAGDGEVNITVSGGWDDITTPGTYTYQWRKKDTNENFGTDQNLNATDAGKPIEPGTYVVTVYDEIGCSATYEATIITPEDWDINLNTSNNTIPNVTPDIAPNGTANGSVVLGPVSGGTSTGMYTYKWYLNVAGSATPTVGATVIDDSGATMSLSGLNPTDNLSYYLVIDGDGAGTCAEKIVEFTIGDNSKPLAVNVKGTSPVCEGELGTIDFTISSGTPPYILSLKRDGDPVVQYTTSDANYTVSDLLPGTYKVTVEDDMGGIVEPADVIIDTPTSFSISSIVVSYPATSCTASITVELSDNKDYDVVWFVPPGADKIDPHSETGPAAPAVTSFVETGLTAKGEYTVRVINADGCYVEETVTVDEPSFTLAEDTNAHQDVSCNGGNDGSLTVIATGQEPGHTFTYEWTDGTVTHNTANTPSIASNLVTAGTWGVKVTSEDGCERTLSGLIVQEPKPLLLNHSEEDITTCSVDESGKIHVHVTGGTAPYTVDLNNGTVSLSQTGVSGDFTFAGLLAADNYNITVVDGNTCSVSESDIEIKAPEVVVVTTPVGVIPCKGAKEGVITFDISGGVEDAGGNSEYDVIVDGVNNGFYRSFIVAEGTFNSFTELGGAYLGEGTYIIEVRDRLASNDLSGACPDPAFSGSVTLEQIRISGMVTNKSCTNGTVNDGAVSDITITGTSGNYTWEWYHGGVLDQSGTGIVPNMENLDAGNYSLKVIDVDRGCDVTEPFVIETGKTIAIIDYAKQNVTCNGGNDGGIALTAYPAGGKYVYSINGTDWQESNVFTGLTTDGNLSKIYTTYVKDLDYGCQSAGVDIEITQPTAITITNVDPINITHVTCQGEADGSFTAVATDGVGSLLKYAVTTVTSPTPVYQDSPVFTGLAAGSYHLWVKRVDDGCEVYQEDYATVTEPTNGALSVGLNAKTDVNCYGKATGAIDINVSGGWGTYTYEWRNKETNVLVSDTDQDITGLVAGTYVVVVKDAEGCSAGLEVTIDSPEAWDIDLNVTANTIPNTTHDVAPDGTANGTATLSPVSGGSDPGSYVYDWYVRNASGVFVKFSANTTTTAYTNLNPGNYYVQITGGGIAGCDQIKYFTIGDTSQPLAIDVYSENPICFGETGDIRVSVTAGTPPYVISIQRNADPIQTVTTSESYTIFENQLAGDYTITVTDAAGGAVSDTEFIVDPAEIIVTGSAQLVAGCEAQITAKATVDVGANYMGTWTVPTGAPELPDVDPINSGVAFNPPNVTIGGAYTFTVTNKTNGCSESYTIIVPEPEFMISEDIRAA